MSDKKPIDILLERLNVIESKLNKLIQQRVENDDLVNDVHEIKQMMVLFLDEQSHRKDFAGRNSANVNNASSKKEYNFPIERIPEDQRPANWNFEISQRGVKKTLWQWYQTSEGRDFLMKIKMSEKTDEKIAQMKKKIVEFSLVAKDWYVKLSKIEKNKRS